MDFSIIIPIYNNENTIITTWETLDKNSKEVNFPVNFLFIDDGSNDRSVEFLEIKKKHDNRIKIIQFDKNYGQLAAIYAGLIHSDSTYTLLISADLQEEENLASNFIINAEKNQNTDLFIGLRKKNTDFFIFKIFSKLFYKLIQLKIKKMPQNGFDTFCIRYDLKEKFIASFEKSLFGQLSLIELSNDILYVSYNRKKSATNKFYLKSILFKISYFYSCLKYVYYDKGKSKKINPPYFKIKE